jgi:hypothetical protein
MHGGMKKLTLKGQCNESSKLNPETNQFLPFSVGTGFFATTNFSRFKDFCCVLNAVKNNNDAKIAPHINKVAAVSLTLVRTNDETQKSMYKFFEEKLASGTGLELSDEKTQKQKISKNCLFRT